MYNDHNLEKIKLDKLDKIRKIKREKNHDFTIFIYNDNQLICIQRNPRFPKIKFSG